MKKSHATLAGIGILAVVAAAQSTQNQSNIARLVNVINKVTANVDGIVPLREHLTIRFQTSAWNDNGEIPAFRWEVPMGYRAQIRYGNIDGPQASVWLDEGGPHYLKLGTFNNTVPYARDLGLQDLTLNEGQMVIFGVSSTDENIREGIATIVLEEIQ